MTCYANCYGSIMNLLRRSFPKTTTCFCIFFCLGFMFSPEVSGQSSVPKMPERSVGNNVLYSADLPEISVQVAEEFEYLGKFDFTLKGIAYGERYIFADVQNLKVERLFIFQFEGFLPNNEHTYNYDFSRAEEIAGYRVRHNTWAYSNSQSQLEASKGEGALTAFFLASKGLQLEEELMMSRFLMVPDDERRHELIIF